MGVRGATAGNRTAILRDCRLKGDGDHQAMLGIARLRNLALAGRRRGG
ncbi:hypothetical protein [Streptomyces canus]